MYGELCLKVSHVAAVPGLAWDSYSWNEKRFVKKIIWINEYCFSSGSVTLHLAIEVQKGECENCDLMLPYNFIHKCAGKIAMYMFVLY